MKKLLKRLLAGFAALFILANVMAFFHARKFTHFDPGLHHRADPGKMSFPARLGVLLTGLGLPRPVNDHRPARPFREVMLQSNVRIVCWEMQPAMQPIKGTIVLCHGYGGKKSDMLDRAYVFLDAGYSVLLPDFMGAGGSEGNQCTIGYWEAENVKTCVAYLQQQGERSIYLFGSSMGAAAIMRACSLEALPVKALILECPFGTMRQTVRNRFEMMGVPAFPLADLLVFWGGVENGFNAFRHNPESYALQIRQPALLLCGGRDDRVKRSETEAIFANLAGPKQHIYYPLAGHESYLNNYRQQWTGDVLSFLAQYP